MADQITFLGEGGQVAVEISGYEREASDNEDDANWLNSTIAIQATPFSGAFAVSLTTHELAMFHAQLQTALQALSGTVTFQTTEEDLSLEFKFGTGGSVSVSGVARPHRSAAGALHFRLQSDQSSIGLALRQLSSALRHFPAREAA